MKRIFIDGSAGTTGLRIYERLGDRRDLELIRLPGDRRKDPAARQEAIHAADVAFLCLPDDAAREAVALSEGADTVLIDTSTAHRTNPAWAYGFPELAGAREKIAASRRIANPGCHASGFVALVAPLVAAGLLPADAAISAFSLTGYSGGGKKMIAEYEDTELDPLLEAPRAYGLTGKHKHLPEMLTVTGLTVAPVFTPIVANFYSGMEVGISLHASQLRGSIAEVRECLAAAYPSGLVRYVESADEGGFLSAAAMSGRDDMLVTVTGNDERILLVSLFDNLGKGASGAAIQNMNIILGVAEETGLVIGE